MKKLLLIVLVVVILLVKTTPVFSQTQLSWGSSASLKFGFTEKDNRLQILKTFLEKYNSPLAPFTEEFINSADAYGIDWKIIPAITGVESTFGKQIPGGSYNAYGWNNGAWKFKSWPDSIWYVTSQLKTRYIAQELITVEQIGPIYAPPSKTWAWKVKYFMNQIENTNTFVLDL